MPSTRTIRYSQSTLQAIINQNANHGKFVFTHELGHVLGLADANSTNPSPATVMNNVGVPIGTTCGASSFASYPPTTLVTLSNDGTKAGQCAAQARSSVQFDGLPPENVNVVDGDGTYCVHHYIVYEQYDCSDESGCVYVDEYWQYMSTDCP